MDSNTHMSPGVVVAGRYKIERQLGEGGMGVVCLALDTRLEQRSALKFLSPDIQFDEEAMAIMRRETLRSRQLTHPNIVRIHDFHHPDDSPPFIAMEYVDGATANSLKLRLPNARLTWDHAAPIVAQICDALNYAHTRRVVHRDLKPANILIDSQGRAKLADFGIAATMRNTLSHSTQAISGSGTPAFMSPEQMCGDLASVADDIYSLGATIHDLLTGSPPFHSGDIGFQVWHAEAPTIPDRLREIGVENDVPAYVAKTVSRCLEKEAKDRPGSIPEVAASLRLELATPAAPVASLSSGLADAAGLDDSETVAARPNAPLSPITRPIRRIATWICLALLLACGLHVAIHGLNTSSSRDRPPESHAPTLTPTAATAPANAGPPVIPAGKLVNLIAPEYLHHAATISVLRNNSISTAGGVGRFRRLASLAINPWPLRSEEWHLTNGELTLAIEAVAKPMSRERTIWFPFAYATNFEVGYAYIWPKSELPTKQATTFFGRSSTNHTADLSGMWSSLDGVATSDPEWRPMWLQAMLPGEAANGVPRFLWGIRPADVEPFTTDYLTSHQDHTTEEIVDRLRNSKTTKNGGSWIVIQAYGPKYRILHNDRKVYHGDLASSRFDTQGARSEIARHFINKGGAIGITTHYQDPDNPGRYRYGDILFRSLDGSPPPQWATDAPGSFLTSPN